MIILCLLLLSVSESYAFQKPISCNALNAEKQAISYVPQDNATILDFLANSYTNIPIKETKCTSPIIWATDNNNLIFTSGPLGGQCAHIFNIQNDDSLIIKLYLYFSKNFLIPMTLSPDGTQLAFGDNEDGTILIDNMRRDKLEFYRYSYSEVPNQSQKGITHLEWSPDANTMAFTNRAGVLFVWNKTEKTVCSSSEENVENLPSHFARSSTSSTHANDVVGEISKKVITKTSCSVFEENVGNRPPYFLRALAWSHDGNFIAAGTVNGEIYIYDLKTGKKIEHELPDNGFNINSLAWSPNNSKIACVAEYDHLYILTPGINQIFLLDDIHHTIKAIRWYSEHELSAISEDCKLHIWDLTRKKHYVYQLLDPDDSLVSWASWSPDGSILAFSHHGLLHLQNIPPLELFQLNKAQTELVARIITRASFWGLTYEDTNVYQALPEEWKSLLKQHVALSHKKKMAELRAKITNVIKIAHG